MIRTNQPERGADDETEKKSGECWSKDAQAQCIRVECGDETIVFPYAHLGFARLRRENNRDVLDLSFSSHQVEVRGKGLRELLLAIQKFTADWIQATPARYEPLAAKRSVFIQAIEVREIADDHQ